VRPATPLGYNTHGITAATAYRRTLQGALDDAHVGKFRVLIIWPLDRIVREGTEDALRVFRQFRQ
jgi:hypothetical protein